MKKYLNIFANGIIKENPLLVIMIGLCSSLAVTTSLANGFGMGCAMTFVLVMSELIISLFRKLIPQSIRIPIFIIVIASFTTIVDLLMQAFFPSLSESMGVFIPLIVVNCIIMGRVESFASKRSPLESVFDALGMGIGYLWVLCGISFIRELLGNGTLLGFKIIPENYTVAFFSKTAGGFFVFGMFIAVTQTIRALTATEKKSTSSFADSKNAESTNADSKNADSKNAESANTESTNADSKNADSANAESAKSSKKGATK